MRLYEVIFWGSHGNGDAKDTIYLVRANDFGAAVEEVSRNASPSHHNGQRYPVAHVVYEIGVDGSLHTQTHPGILRGPYFASAYNCGWRSWHRKLKNAEYTTGWEEETK